MFIKQQERGKYRPTNRLQEYHDEDTAQDINEIFQQEDTEAKPAKQGFMAELEEWLAAEIYGPIEAAIIAQDAKELHLAFDEATVQIKRKVLSSYHNGLKAKTNGSRKPYRSN